MTFEEWWGVRQGASLEERAAAEAIWNAARVATVMELAGKEGRVYNSVAVDLLEAEPELEAAIDEWFENRMKRDYRSD